MVSSDVLIIGSGIVGVSCGLWLRRLGCSVTIVDRSGVASMTSYGNAGILASSSVVPVPTPGILSKIPKMLLSSDGPLFMRWGSFLSTSPFLFRFLLNARHSRVESISDSLSLLLHDCVDQHLSLAEGTDAEKYISLGSLLYGYGSRSAYASDSYGWDLRRRRGHRFDELTATDITAYDPHLADRFATIIRCRDTGYITDPQEYIRALMRHGESEGIRFVRAEVDDIVTDGDCVSGVMIDGTIHRCDHVVLASGIWSRDFLSKFGYRVPMEPERGYHVEFLNPSIELRSPVMVSSSKFVLTPMRGRLRAAGLVEFGGMSPETTNSAFSLLKRRTLALFPDLEYDGVHEWLGYRPSTIDSLPLIGGLDKVANLWCAFGHQHIGLSSGPKTGRWLSQMIMGHLSNSDLSAFDPNRFS